jgi:hypothetical protein
MGEQSTIKHHSDRIGTIKNRIRLVESNYPNATDNIIQLKEELALLLDEEAKRELVRRLRLYSSSATGYRWFCSACFDQAYHDSRIKAKES